MKNFYFLLFSVFCCACLFSCKPGGSNVVAINNAQRLILGNWNLQQEKFTQYVDNAKQIDTLITASSVLVGHAHFDQNGSFSSAGVSLASSTNLAGPAPGRDSTAGTYTISNTSFYLSPPYLATFPIDIRSLPPVTEAPVITPVSHTAQLIQLTTKLLTIHMEVVYNYVYSSTGVTTNYKTVADMYYSR